MDKEQTLKAIQSIKKAHKARMYMMKKIVSGAEVDIPTIFSKKECKFGKWLYDEDNNLFNILGTMFYDRLEIIHSQWHLEYTKIFELCYKKKRKSFSLESVWCINVNSMDFDKAKLYYSELELTTQEFLKALGSSERRISALPASTFNK